MRRMARTSAKDTLAARVKQRRLELGMSQHTLGVAAGVREQTIGRIEHGAATSVATVQAVAKALKCSVGDLLD